MLGIDCVVLGVSYCVSCILCFWWVGCYFAGILLVCGSVFLFWVGFGWVVIGGGGLVMVWI